MPAAVRRWYVDALSNHRAECHESFDPDRRPGRLQRRARLSRPGPDREGDAARRHRRRVLPAGPRARLRGPERHAHPLRPGPHRRRRERSAPRQDRHHPGQPHARRPRRQRAQQGAELGHLRGARHVGLGDAQLERREHRDREEIEDRHRQRDAAVLRRQAQGQRRRSGQLDRSPASAAA